VGRKQRCCWQAAEYRLDHASSAPRHQPMERFHCGFDFTFFQPLADTLEFFNLVWLQPPMGIGPDGKIVLFGFNICELCRRHFVLHGSVDTEMQSPEITGAVDEAAILVLDGTLRLWHERQHPRRLRL